MTAGRADRMLVRGALLAFACLLMLPASLPASAAGTIDITLVGLFPGKAVLVVGDAPPKTYAVGSQIADGYRLVAVDDRTATLSAHGRTEVIPMGSHANHVAPPRSNSITLQSDSDGHYVTRGEINGGPITMLVDTGATLITLPASDAVRLGIDYKRGQPGVVSTANGTTTVFRVRLDSVRVGDIQLSQVDAAVQETGLPFALLGMSFLNRTDMNRSGSQLTLTKRF